MTTAPEPGTESTPRADHPPVAELLAVDRQYRRTAAGRVLEVTRGPRRYTVAFSNSPLALRFHRTRDWVVLRYHEEDGGAGHATVVTARLGPMKGRRLVRGREQDCFAYYRDVARERGPRHAARARAAASAA